MALPWHPNLPLAPSTRAALNAHLDELPEIRHACDRGDGLTTHIRVKPARALEWVRVHVQPGTGAYDPAAPGAVSTLHRVAGLPVFDTTFTRDGTTHYTAWIIPVGHDETAAEVRFDGTAGHGPDRMSFLDLGV
jgi:hypothetical protein